MTPASSSGNIGCFSGEAANYSLMCCTFQILYINEQIEPNCCVLTSEILQLLVLLASSFFFSFILSWLLWFILKICKYVNVWVGVSNNIPTWGCDGPKASLAPNSNFYEYLDLIHNCTVSCHFTIYFSCLASSKLQKNRFVWLLIWSMDAGGGLWSSQAMGIQ